MNKKLTLPQKDQIYILSLKGYREYDIAKKLKTSQSTVSRVLTSITKDHNYQLSLTTISVFLEEFQRYGDFLTNQIRELEEMKNSDDVDKLELMDAQFKKIEALIEKSGKGKLILALWDMVKAESKGTGEGSKGLSEIEG